MGGVTGIAKSNALALQFNKEREMETYIYWTVGILAIQASAKLIVLGTGNIPPRTTMTLALGSIFNISLLIWGVAVLAAP